MKLAVIITLVVVISIILVPDAFATTKTRSEGNYDIKITMNPDPVNNGANADFCVKVTLFDGDNNPNNNVDAHGDFDELKLTIGGNVFPLVWNEELECFFGNFPVNKGPLNKTPVTVQFFPVPAPPGQSQSPDGEWGTTNSAADPNQDFWELTHKNPLYFETEGPTDPAIGNEFIALIILAIIAAIVIGAILYRKR
jgi:hypothetical protein